MGKSLITVFNDLETYLSSLVQRYYNLSAGNQLAQKLSLSYDINQVVEETETLIDFCSSDQELQTAVGILPLLLEGKRICWEDYSIVQQKNCLS